MKRKLPKYVTAFFDRHGKERFRYRRSAIQRYLRGPFNSPEFKEDLKAAKDCSPVPRLERSNAGTVDDLVARYYASAGFRNAGAARQKTSRGIIEAFRSEFGSDRVADFTFEHIEAILLTKSRKRSVGKRIVGGASAAVSLQKQLRRLFRYAVKLGLITANPAELADSVQAPTGGRHTWTEDEIAAYRHRHPLGTKARLALEIILWTGQRRGDAISFGPQHIRGGKIEFVASKGNKVMRLPAAPQLLAAIRAMPSVGLKTYLVTDYGKPFSGDGFGNWFADRCKEAGVPGRAHGLRKAIARRAAELEATQAMLKAIGGWEQDSEVATYTKGADQARLA
jgi:integrase